LSFTEGKPMDVATHPHMGLQTVTWLLAGEVVHNDSLGYESLLRPGGVNIMTSGGAIAHAEETPPHHSGRLDGVQLWTALPEQHRHGAAEFQHLEETPTLELSRGLVRVFAGSVGPVTSGARHFSSILGADLQIHPRAELEVPLDSSHENALLVLAGNAELLGFRLKHHTLYYLGTGREDIALRSDKGARVLVIGGAAFPEPILMWWNFVARTPEEIAEARAAWQSRARFGEVKGYKGPRLEAPVLARFARPNPAS
jgi:hypothetical protein